MLDMLDILEDERRRIRLTLITGEIVEGHSERIIWLEDDEGWETIKAIWFMPSWSKHYYALREEEIVSYEIVE